jgi:phage-related protein
MSADVGELRASINPGIVTSIAPLRMASLTASYKYNLTPTSYAGFRVNTVQTFGGGLNMTTPSGVSYDEATDQLSVQYTNTKMAVQDGLPKFAAWAEFASADPKKNLSYSVYAGWQQQNNVSNPAVGFNLSYKFN